ncbi:MAG: hypothetical protein AAGG38_06265 [Planctomycetota bacterium]
MHKRAHKLSFEQRFGVDAATIRRLWKSDFEPMFGTKTASLVWAWAVRPETTAKQIGERLNWDISTTCAMARCAHRRIADMDHGRMRHQLARPVLEKLGLAEASSDQIEKVVQALHPARQEYVAAAVKFPRHGVRQIAKYCDVKPGTISLAIRKVKPVVRRLRHTPRAEHGAHVDD